MIHNKNELGVRPRSPRAILSVAEHRYTSALPGAGAPLVERATDASELRALLSAAPEAPRAPVVPIEGDAGVGKTRLALDVSYGFATTVVAPTGVALRREDLSDVPLDGPAVLIIDDAHRNPDQSGVAAMLHDPRRAVHGGLALWLARIGRLSSARTRYRYRPADSGWGATARSAAFNPIGLRGVAPARRPMTRDGRRGTAIRDPPALTPQGHP